MRTALLSPRLAVLLALAGCRGRCENRSRIGTTPTAQAEAGAPAVEAGTPRATFVTRRAAFPVQDVSLTVEDLHMSRRIDLTLAQSSAEVVVNGGFFDEKGDPIGLAVSAGKSLSKLAPQMSGGVLTIAHGTARLVASEDYAGEPAEFAIQCRPRLVVQSRVNIRSDDGRHAARTALCIKNEGRDIEVVVAGLEERAEPTLLELAVELRDDGCEEALNLDGGPSSGWASRIEGGSAVDLPRAPVRHAVAVRRR
jgi:hypothetical protein